MIMSHLTSIVAVLLTSLLFNGFPCVEARKIDPVKMQRYVSLNGCRCNNLQCECCAGIDLSNSPHRDFCLKVQLIPNEVALRVTVSINGNTIYTGQLDPSLAAICPPVLGGICLTINHVDIQKRQVCAKLTIVFFTILKFPCIGQQNGQLTVVPNTYS